MLCQATRSKNCIDTIGSIVWPKPCHIIVSRYTHYRLTPGLQASPLQCKPLIASTHRRYHVPNYILHCLFVSVKGQFQANNKSKCKGKSNNLETAFVHQLGPGRGASRRAHGSGRRHWHELHCGCHQFGVAQCCQYRINASTRHIILEKCECIFRPSRSSKK